MGFVFTLGKGAVAWASWKQRVVALSSMEVEYIASTVATCDAIHIRKLLADLGLVLKSATPLLINNQSAIALTQNPVHHCRTKHIDVRHHFIREKVANGTILPEYIPTDNQPADILMKPLPALKFEKFWSLLGVQGVNAP
jgi:hypothetical protein